MKRLSTRVRLTLALAVCAVGSIGACGVTSYGATVGHTQQHYLAGDGVPFPPKMCRVVR